MKKLLIAAVFIAIAVVVVNDVGNYLQAMWRLDSGSREIVNAAAEAAQREKNIAKPGGMTAVESAKEKGLVLYGYQCQGNLVEVWVSHTVKDTWVAGPLLAWMAGKPLDTPFELTQHDTAFIP